MIKKDTKKDTVQQTLFGETVKSEEDEFKKITVDDFKGEHKCPRCGFEWND